jgi:hypothetical protein
VNAFAPFEILLGASDAPHLRLSVLGYEHPEVAEPLGYDLLQCRVFVHADPIEASFDLAIGAWELRELREYLETINSANGPPRSLELAGGLLSLSFAPSRRGPVLCAAMLKTIDASHVRLEFLITLEPAAISQALSQLAPVA